jgi:DNA repair exonuclease SbcCD nuclease subunit
LGYRRWNAPEFRVITFVHTADWQIGKPFATISDPAKRARVQQERIEAIRRIGHVVRERRASFVVVAGDLFDSPTPTHATVAAALGAIASLEVPVYCIPGNHDHGGPDSLWEQPFFKSEHGRLAANFHLVLESEPVVVNLSGPTADGDPSGVVLLPCPLRRRHEADDPTAWIRSLDFTPFGSRPRIVIAHGSTTIFAPGGDGSSWFTPSNAGQPDDEEFAATTINTLALDRLPMGELDYVALGDWHGFLSAGPKAFYSGAPEIDRFPKSGQRPGHVAVVTLARGSEPQVEAVATGRFRWLVHAASLSAHPGGDHADRSQGAGETGVGQLDDWLVESTRPTAVGEAGFDACLVRLQLTGSVSLADRAALDRLVESWTARLLRLDVDDRTTLAPSPDEVRELAERPGDPIIARVAGELMALLDGELMAMPAGKASDAARSGGTADTDSHSTDGPDPDVVRQAIHMLHALVSAADHTEETAVHGTMPGDETSPALLEPAAIATGETQARRP